MVFAMLVIRRIKMANSHPYISGPSNIAQMVSQLRRKFPAKVTSETVKKLGIAPNNESYVVNVLQFIGIIDAEGNKTELADKPFNSVRDEDFAKHFEPLVKNAYSSLFELHGDGSWTATDDDLITFFRQTDRTGDAIGRRQAAVFKVLASLAGHGEVPVKSGKGRTAGAKPGADVPKPKGAKSAAAGSRKRVIDSNGANREFGLSVRIEVNLPAGGTKQNYDDIFKSIRENLIDG